MSPQAFIFMGRYGSGKGTQAKLLMDLLKKKTPEKEIIYVETGAGFREYAEGDSYSAKLTKDTIDNGGLMPEFMCVYIWGTKLADKCTGIEHLVFDGTPRKLLEAQLLESVFPFYGMGKPWVIYLDVHHEESHKRISLRQKDKGRADDSKDAIERRKFAYENDIVPSIEYYRKNANFNFLDVNGIGTIEDIHADIVKRVGLV